MVPMHGQQISEINSSSAQISSVQFNHKGQTG